jgi:hypothetical protein
MLNKILGIVLIAAGVFALVYGGFKFTTREKVFEMGPVEVQADREKNLAVPPVAGAVLVGAGALLLVFGGRRRGR